MKTNKIDVIRVQFNVLGQAHRFYDKRLKNETVYETEIKKIHETAHVVSTDHALVTAAEYLENSFTQLKSWNRQLEERFDHIDKEALK